MRRVSIASEAVLRREFEQEGYTLRMERYSVMMGAGKKLCAVFAAAIVILFCSCQTARADAADLFDAGDVHRIDIMLSDRDWSDLLSHPVDKTKYKADLLIDGEPVNNVSFATKGTSSLLIAASDPENDRYSLKVNFGYFTEGQTWHTLRELHLLSMFADATYMKDYLCYSMFRKMEVPAPRASYVWLTVNGEDHGLYLAVENMDEHFLAEGSLEGGSLYKPEEDSNPGADPTAGPAKPFGADLVYSDDSADSYGNIFNNTVTEEDPDAQARVIRSLKSLQDRQNLKDCLDTEEIIRYFAVHNFVGNYDSYTGPKSHNFYLYERDEKLALFPWDYNLAFGAFPSDGQFGHVSDSTWVVNQGIDTPLVCVTEDARPMWRWIVSDAAYLEEYHRTVNRLIKDYFESGAFEKEIDELHEMLFPYVEKDPTAFYSPEEFEAAYRTLRELCLLRAASVRLQLDGLLSADTDLQTEETRVDASQLSVKAMGVIEEK